MIINVILFTYLLLKSLPTSCYLCVCSDFEHQHNVSSLAKSDSGEYITKICYEKLFVPLWQPVSMHLSIIEMKVIDKWKMNCGNFCLNLPFKSQRVSKREEKKKENMWSKNISNNMTWIVSKDNNKNSKIFCSVLFLCYTKCTQMRLPSSTQLRHMHHKKIVLTRNRFEKRFFAFSRTKETTLHTHIFVMKISVLYSVRTKNKVKGTLIDIIIGISVLSWFYFFITFAMSTFLFFLTKYWLSISNKCIGNPYNNSWESMLIMDKFLRTKYLRTW